MKKMEEPSHQTTEHNKNLDNNQSSDDLFVPPNRTFH